MIDSEKTWDKLLQIKTNGRDDSNSDQYRYPYEPTPYCVLERLANSGFLRKKDVVLDYGCGKGRVDFFLSYQTKANTIGIEYDERIYRNVLENQKTVVAGAKTEFVLARAEEYEVPPEVNKCYFFNPFSVEILRKVMARIIESYYAQPREMFLFFYCLVIKELLNLQRLIMTIDGAMKGENIMKAFDNSELKKYQAEVKEKWGKTDAYKEHTEKTKHYSKDKWSNLAEEMNDILAEFAVCMKNDKEPNSNKAQNLVKMLQNHITENYYLCTNDILVGLGQMYVVDERFKNNIDKHADGTANFIGEAIEVYCKKGK